MKMAFNCKVLEPEALGRETEGSVAGSPGGKWGFSGLSDVLMEVRAP